MTVVDDPVVAAAPGASAAGGAFGDGFVWFPADDTRDDDGHGHITGPDGTPIC